MNDSQRPVVSAGTTLGMGLGGFFDGILFHQILQVHGMLSARLPKDTLVNVEINTFWDGIFHAATWLLTCAGVWMLFRAAQRREVVFLAPTFVGALLLGWGMFNVVEGAIDHHVLHLHHVVERLGVSIFDWAFLAWGAAMIAAGWLMIRADARVLARHPGHQSAPAHR